MKRLLILGSLVFAATLFVQADVSSAATVSDYTAGMPAGGIGGSRHNLGAFGRVITTGATTEICVFCHTPHHTNQSMGPIWNRGIAPSSFTPYGNTIAGSVISKVNSPSLACLSCHDGVTTFDNIVNAPGKGGIISGGQDRNWSFNMPSGSGITASASYDAFYTDSGNYVAGHPELSTTPGLCLECHSGGPFVIFDASLLQSMNIGTDLSNDHPVSVAYAGGVKASLRPVDSIISNIPLKDDLIPDADTAYGNNLAQNRWSVNGFISNTATISDLLRDGNVECTSCHDPHFSNKSWDEVEPTWQTPWWSSWCSSFEDCSDGLFLRRVGGNTGSGVCRTCHNK